jgi:hypothetical protein
MSTWRLFGEQVRAGGARPCWWLAAAARCYGWAAPVMATSCPRYRDLALAGTKGPFRGQPLGDTERARPTQKDAAGKSWGGPIEAPGVVRTWGSSGQEAHRRDARSLGYCGR